MSLWIFYLLGGVLLAAGAWFLARGRAKPAPMPVSAPRKPAVAAHDRDPPAAQALKAQPTPPIAPKVAAPVAAEPLPESAAPAVPADLEAFQLARIGDVDPAVLERIIEGLKGIARPPQAFYELVSPEFLARATSVQLADIVLGEPVVAAKVVARVNSPLYQLSRPVTQIGQAITFMGIAAVRSICLAYLLDESFRDEDPKLRRDFETIRESGTVASELCSRLAQRLRLSDPGALVTQVLLSFIGHFAAAQLQSRLAPGNSLPLGAPLLERLRMQQQRLGLSAPELGRLLMQVWALPPDLIEQVSAVDETLVMPLADHALESPHRIALGYLCARLGERRVAGSLQGHEDVDALLDHDADFVHLQAYLAMPQLAPVRELLRGEDLWAGLRG